jgi:hypothetical protein
VLIRFLVEAQPSLFLFSIGLLGFVGFVVNLQTDQQMAPGQKSAPEKQFHFIQGVSEIRVLILTSERTRQFMKLFSITFCKIRKSIPRFFAPQF